MSLQVHLSYYGDETMFTAALPEDKPFIDEWLAKYIQQHSETVRTFIRQATAEECYACGQPIHHDSPHVKGCEVAVLMRAYGYTPEEE